MSWNSENGSVRVPALGYHSPMDEGQDSKPQAMDVGEALKRVAILLDVIEQSGADLDELTAPNLQEDDWERLNERACQREDWNPHVFAGEGEAFSTLRGVEDDGIRAEAHKQVMFYWRRAKTSGKIASALWGSYQKAQQSAQDGGHPVDYGDYKKKLSELLSVVTALASEHEQIVTLAQDAQIGDRACATARYEEQISPLLEQFDEMCGQYGKLAKVHFKKRKALLSELRACLTRIDETNRVFEHYGFMSLHTRQLPE